MKRVVLYCLAVMVAMIHIVSAAKIHMEPISINLQNKASLQRGASIYMNYCSGCHSLKYLRYNRMAKDIEITSFSGEVYTDLLYNNLVFTEAKVYDPIQIAMPQEDARTWFGMVPPDLSLKVKERGAHWIYTFLTSFYDDNKRPLGTNNLLRPGVAMPNVFLHLSGRRVAVMNRVDGKEEIDYLKITERGTISPRQFDNMVRDLVNFLAYVSEPNQIMRYRIGIGVLIFLGIFLILTYFLMKTYWEAVKK